MMKSIWKYLRISGYPSSDFGRAHLVGKILECSRDKFRMVMEVLNSRVGKTQGFCQEDQDIFTHFTTNSGLGDRHATNKWLFGHFMNGKIGWPRWTRLPWWSCRSYPPGIIPLSFCLAARCWLEDVKIPLLGGISAAPKVLSSPLSFKSGRCNEYDRPISDDTTGFLGWTNGYPLLKDSLYPAPLENLFQVKT